MPAWFLETLSDLIHGIGELLLICGIAAIFGSTGYFLKQGILYARAKRLGSAWKRWIYSAVATTLIIFTVFKFEVAPRNLTTFWIFVACAVMGYFGYFIVPGDEIFYPDND
jgi:hypothetical protein